MKNKVKINTPQVCEVCHKKTMKRSEKGLRIALVVYVLLGSVLTFASKHDRLPPWLEALPPWLQSVVTILSLGSFLVIAAYATLDTKRSYKCTECHHTMIARHPWPKWMKRYALFMALGLLVFIVLLAVLALVMWLA